MTKSEIISQLEKAKRQLKVAKEQDEIDFVEGKIEKLEGQLAEIEKQSETKETTEKKPVKKPVKKEKKIYPLRDPVMNKQPATLEECKNLLAKARKRVKSSREWREKRQESGKPPQKTVVEVVKTTAEQVGHKTEQLDEKKNY